jgi:hypothetical protein
MKGKWLRKKERKKEMGKNDESARNEINKE